jgi:hypothetical protein
MAPSFSEIVQSEQFTFLIGKDKHSVVVHAAAIAATSAPLQCLINGNMKEGQTKCAEFPDLEVEDFCRFCEYAYRGDFACPAWEIDGTREEKKKKKRSKNDFSTDSSTLVAPPEPMKKSKAESTPPQPKLTKEDLQFKFDVHVYDTRTAPRSSIDATFEPQYNTHKNQCFRPLFLAYARLYVFATIHLIQPLRMLILEKLHETLDNFNLYSCRVPDLIALARYAYENEDLADEDDELRELVLDYIGSQLDYIKESKAFSDLLEDGGLFVRDFWKVARTYLL